jgi:hypothetical protein
MEVFNFIVMSKGIILLNGEEKMQSTIRTFAVSLSAEMAPVATVLVYHVGRYGDIVADSLTFPVNGISRNNVSNSAVSEACEFKSELVRQKLYFIETLISDVEHLPHWRGTFYAVFCVICFELAE